MATAKEIQKRLRQVADPDKAKTLAGFFKTAKGQYGEGDKFLGITAPQQRLIVKEFKDLPIEEIKILLESPWHEDRLTGVLLLVYKFEHSQKTEQKKIFDFYLKERAGINNWDLVDLSADKIIGAWLYDNFDQKLIDKLSSSGNIWDRRIAVLASFYFIKNGRSDLTFALAEKLLYDKHDLIQKAVGWMLREVGKRISEQELVNFLEKYATIMPRTMLRYAIERLSEKDRLAYLKNSTKLNN
ncbi:MAG: DNA alkylation repair protein [Patescibacteria group bacterium]|nr:DNA alkylation repair protein [Patescibacteria group bacterium]